MKIVHKCKCGARGEWTGDTFINGGGALDEKGRVFVVEVRADEWLAMHSHCVSEQTYCQKLEPGTIVEIKK